MGEADLTLNPERESKLSMELAEKALAAAEKASSQDDEDLLAGLIRLGDRLVDATKKTAQEAVGATKGVGKFVHDLWSEVKDIGEAVDEKLDNVVGMVVDPIKEGLASVKKELTAGLDPAMTTGLVVGAVYGMRDKIYEGLKWLWNNADVALQEGWDLLVKGLEKGWEFVKSIAPDVAIATQKLGYAIIGVLEKGWELLKGLAPSIIDGLADIGDWIWGKLPSGLKTALETVHKIGMYIGSLAADIGSILPNALEWIFRKVGLDGLADFFGTLGDALEGIADFLGVTTRGSALQRNAAALSSPEATANDAAMIAAIKKAGGPGAAVFDKATSIGVPIAQAGAMSAWADADAAAAEVALQAYQTATSGGANVAKAMQAARKAFDEARAGRVATVPKPNEAPAVGAGTAAIAADRAAEARTSQQTRDAVLEVAKMQQRAIQAQKAAGKPPEGLDTMGVSDEMGLLAFNAGRASGGQV